MSAVMSSYGLEHLAVKSGGGGTRDGGFFHMSIRSGSRAKAACAAEAYDYIAREGRFDDPELDRAVYCESGNMPSWAGDDAREFWDAADLYERANARLFIEGEFALPRGLNIEDRIELARTFVRELSSLERLPYTFAIHAGEDQEGREHNPHAHVMVSERGDDGLERRPQDWFRQANRQHPERGGAAKSRSAQCRDWVERIRQGVANAINDRLRARGRNERVDHRSYKRQGIDREPSEHIGLLASRIFERTGKSHRLEQATAIENTPRELADLEARIDGLEQLRANLVLEQSAVDQGDEYPYRSAADESSRDTGPER
jgi:hypothetical protein